MESRLGAALTIGALLWSVTLVAAPVALRTPGWPAVAAATLYEAASRICHQRPERSFHLRGVQLPVCARCTGLYVSGAVMALAASLGSSRRVRSTRLIGSPDHTPAVLLLAAIPTALSVGLDFAGLTHSSNIVRAVSALPLGGAAGWIFVRALRADAAPAPSFD